MLAETSLKTDELSAGVTRSLQTTRRSLGMIAGLEGVNRNVEKIVDGIGMVSIQTNMLAVSGSVEAARAGEFGKGFAVVSKDIRNLAHDSGDSAGRIKDTLRAIQDRIIVVRRELEQTIAATEAENGDWAAKPMQRGPWLVRITMPSLAPLSNEPLSPCDMKPGMCTRLPSGQAMRTYQPGADIKRLASKAGICRLLKHEEIVITHPYRPDQAAVCSGTGAARASRMAASAVRPARPVATTEQKSA
jgi:hypothetical protein